MCSFYHARQVVGSHDIDAELCSLLWEHEGKCHVVTRNQHADAISVFLQAAHTMALRLFRDVDSHAAPVEQ